MSNTAHACPTLVCSTPEPACYPRQRGHSHHGQSGGYWGGACVLGNVTLGDGCVVGANAVVLVDVPARGVAVGVPARVIPVNASCWV